ncbi:unnamed protein product, partial [Cercopithifilaria johnstoni]
MWPLRRGGGPRRGDLGSGPYNGRPPGPRGPTPRVNSTRMRHPS